MNIQEQFNNADSSRFQKEFAEFVIKNNLGIVVETGIGVSTINILKSFDDEKFSGVIYSIDPSPWYKYQITHPKLTHLKEKSIHALKDLFIETGPWDAFLHDGNHDIFCQSYEYEFAYGCLKKGGWLCSDDVNWGNNGAWKRFIETYKLQEHTLGTLSMVQKTMPPIRNYEAESYHLNCVALAKEAEKKYLDAGNKLTPCFQEAGI